jgi:L1 cell adhesion molecule like protein
LYSTLSARDTGTLYQVRNLIDARNVTKDPANNYYAAKELLDKFRDAYLINGALYHFGMTTVDSEPTKNVYEGPPNHNPSKEEYVRKSVRCFIDEHVMNDIQEIDMNSTALENNLTCRYCGKKYVRPTCLKKHEEKEHGHLDTSHTSDIEQNTSEDKVYNYTHQVLVLLLLQMNHNNAINLGDGERVIRLYKFFYLYFKISNCPKYAYATLELLAQVNGLLTPRMAYSLTWNRFVNHQGHMYSNHPMDLDLEHDNKCFKNDICSYRGEITERSVNRVGRSVESTDEIVGNYDKKTAVRKPSGRHTQKSTTDDVMIIVEQLQDANVYDRIPGRCHNAFPDMKNDMLDELDMSKFNGWVSKSLKTFSKKHYYK